MNCLPYLIYPKKISVVLHSVKSNAAFLFAYTQTTNFLLLLSEIEIKTGAIIYIHIFKN